VNTVYRQVELQRATAGRIETQVCWLPVQFARKGKVLSIRAERVQSGCLMGGLSDPVHGWVVEKVYGPLSTAKELDRQRASRKDLKSIIVPEDP